MGQRMVRINLYVPKRWLDEYREFSDKTGLSVSEYMRRALENYLAFLRANALGQRATGADKERES